MKKKYLLALTLSLTACANTPSLFDNYGKFPINYPDIVAKEIGEGFIPLFEPRKYKNGGNEGWLSCFENKTTNEKIAVGIKNESVIEKISDINVSKYDALCAVYKSSQDSSWLERSEAYNQKLHEVRYDASKENLFGKYPIEPLIIARGYMFDKIPFPLSAQYSPDYLVTQTYYLDDSGRMVFAYNLDVKINIQNKREKYEGFKTYHITIKDDVVVNFLQATYN